jgi:hypothetical protein
LKRTSGVHSKLMEQSEGGEEGATNVPKKWIILDTDSHRIYKHLSANNLLLLVCEKLIEMNIIFVYVTTGNKLKYCTWSLKIYYPLPLNHCVPFNVSLSMAWITGFPVHSKSIHQEYKGHFHLPVQITLLNGSVLKCQTPDLMKALHLQTILLNT